MSNLAPKLVSARAKAQVLDIGVAANTICSVADAYLIQDELVAIYGGDVRGWKVTGLTPEQQRGYRTETPVAGALFDPFFYTSPACLDLQQFIAPLLECEISYLLGEDLPPRDRPYGRAEIEAAVDAIAPAMEIADCRWPAEAPDLLKLADDMGNGAFVVGAAISNWRGVDLRAQDVVLTFAGAVDGHGSCARVLGDPLQALLALANAQPLPAGGLRKGQIVTTGTCTAPVPLKAGQYIADFGVLGRLSLSVC